MPHWRPGGEDMQSVFSKFLDDDNDESEEEPVLNTERTKPYFASDSLGRKVEIKPDQRPYRGKNGKIIALAKSERVVHDDHNQAYAIPKGAKYFKNKDGTLTVQKKTGQGDALKLSKKMASNPNKPSVIEGAV